MGGEGAVQGVCGGVQHGLAAAQVRPVTQGGAQDVLCFGDLRDRRQLVFDASERPQAAGRRHVTPGSTALRYRRPLKALKLAADLKHAPFTPRRYYDLAAYEMAQQKEQQDKAAAKAAAKAGTRKAQELGDEQVGGCA